MKEREKIISLYDIYKNLLTESGKEYFEYYYFEDLSLSEIAEIKKVSKSYVGKTLNKIEEKLNAYDKALGVYNIYSKLSQIAKNTSDSKTKKELENLLK